MRTYRLWYGNRPGNWHTSSETTLLAIKSYITRRNLNVVVEVRP